MKYLYDYLLRFIIIMLPIIGLAFEDWIINFLCVFISYSLLGFYGKNYDKIFKD